jgi:signal transduction histidine kinase
VEVLDYINKNRLDVAVTMITSYASLDLAVAATKKGAFNFVPKPFTPAELKSAVENATKHLYLKRMTLQMNTEGKQLRFQFLSVLSHELKAPLNAIEGYLKLMQDKTLGNDLAKYDEMVNRSFERVKGMRSLIMDLLDLTRLESQGGEKTKTKVDVTAVCKMAIDTIQPVAIQKNINVISNLDEDIIFYANPTDIEIIINNILSNAVKYNQPNGLVILDLEQKDNTIIICAEDTGIGIAEEDMDKLFLEFTRIKNEETKFISGSGLGLSILKKTVESYNGKVDVKSKLGQGTKFTITLPIYKKTN